MKERGLRDRERDNKRERGEIERVSLYLVAFG